MDVEIIKTIRPSITGVSDSTIWIHTNDDQYSAKSGYKFLRNFCLHQDKPNTGNVDRNLLSDACSSIWKLDAPPKIKHFWWKVAHNSISTEENLHKRKMVGDNTCQLCGEHLETTNHLIFQCRNNKEIWNMTPSIQIPGDNLLRNSLLENVSILLTLGNGKRKPIPDVINQALIDYNKIWKNTSEANELQVELPESYTITAPKRCSSIDDIIIKANTL